MSKITKLTQFVLEGIRKAKQNRYRRDQQLPSPRFAQAPFINARPIPACSAHDPKPSEFATNTTPAFLGPQNRNREEKVPYGRDLGQRNIIGRWGG